MSTRLTMRDPRHAVVLVAGLGSRLRGRVSAVPKCLVEVNSIPILSNALHCLERANVSETVLVVGYLDAVIRRRVGDRVGRMRIAYRANRDYRTTGTSQSLLIGLEGIDGDVLVLEGDVYFEPRVLDRLLGTWHRNATLVDRWKPTLDGSVVQLRRDRTIRAWVHKKDRPPDFALERTFKTVNMHRFSRVFLRDRLRPALAAESDRGGREPIETVFGRLVANGARIDALDVEGRWVEIDDESDLQTAQATFSGAAHESR